MFPVDKARAQNGSGTIRVEKNSNIYLGQWYWVKDKDNNGHESEWLGAVTKIGSNYVEVSGPHGRYGYPCDRVHFDDFWEKLRLEENPDAIIQREITFYQSNVNQCLEKIRSIVNRLGVPDRTLIPDKQPQTGSNALVVLSGTPDIKKYQSDLIKAKDQDLPELFEEVKINTQELTRWMTANTLPLEAVIKEHEGSIGHIKDRIFNVTLYAGLTEEVVKCCDGEPASYNEKLRVMQRRLYMDEECLLNYRHGGMEFHNIDEFDEWLCAPENRDRILPFPRCLVAMRVRRIVKEREYDGKLITAFINIALEKSDKFTFLYLRNGEQVYRLSTELEFGEMIFPDKSLYDPGCPMMINSTWRRVDDMMTVSEYEERCKEYRENEIKCKEWEKQNPGEHHFNNPFRRYIHDFRPHEWKPFDQSNVYFDDCMEKISADIKQYNRIAMIIQGLFDRSPVFHPHPSVRTWTPDGFSSAIELIYDGATTLYGGEKPDFEEYRRQGSSLINADSVVIGQEVVWMTREAEKENNRVDRDWRNQNKYHCSTFRPWGDPGPGYISKIHKWKPRSREAAFSWERERRGMGYFRDDSPVKCTITVPAGKLFNVSAYKIGDYKQFFLDPRTRAEYLQWAPLLLAAEEFLVSNIKDFDLRKKET